MNASNDRQKRQNVREKDGNYNKIKYLLVKKPRGRSMTQNKRPKVQIIIQCINLPTFVVRVSVKCISTAIFSRFRNSLFRD